MKIDCALRIFGCMNPPQRYFRSDHNFYAYCGIHIPEVKGSDRWVEISLDQLRAELVLLE